MKALWILLLTLLTGSSVFAGPWEQAREAYDAGDFVQARELYQGVARDGVSPELDYNLGNTLMRLGETERALAHYRRAQWLSPGDPDLRANLARAVEETDARVPPLPPLRRLTGFLDARQWQLLFMAICWLLAAVGLARRWIAPLRRAWAWVLPALATTLAVAGLGVYGSRPEPLLEEGVLRGETVTARFEPLEDATEHFSLPGGSVVRLTDTARTWVRIEVDGKAGWVPKDRVLALSAL